MSVNDTDPALLFGGTWERIEGLFLLGASEEYPAGTTGGEATHKLTIAEMPSHSHQVNATTNNAASGNQQYANISPQRGSTYSTGGNQPHNNMPPYLAVYIWKRVS